MIRTPSLLVFVVGALLFGCAEPTRSVVGVVRDADDQPLPGARVQLALFRGELCHTWTDDEGRFAFEEVPRVAAIVGVDELCVDFPDRSEEGPRLWIEAFEPACAVLDAEADVSVDLRVLGRLRLRGVLVGEAAAREGLELDLLTNGGSTEWRRVAVSDRRFELRGLDPLLYVLRVRDGEQVLAMQRIELSASREDVVLSLEDPAVLATELRCGPGIDWGTVWLRPKIDAVCAEQVASGRDGDPVRLPLYLHGDFVLDVTGRLDGGGRTRERSFLLPHRPGEPLPSPVLPVTVDAPVTLRPHFAGRPPRPSEGTLHARHTSGLESESRELQVLLEDGEVLFDASWQRAGPAWEPLSLPTGEGWTLIVELGGYDTLHLPLPASGSRQVDLPLQVNDRVEVRLWGGERPTIGNFEIDILSADGTGASDGKRLYAWSYNVFSEARVRTWLRPGTYRFRFRSKFLVQQELGPFELRAGDSPFLLDVPRESGLTLSGEVRDGADPYAVGFLHLFRKQGSTWLPMPQKAEALGPDGSCIPGTRETDCAFSFEGLVPGTYRLALGAHWTYASPDTAVVAEIDLRQDTTIVLAPPHDS